MRTRRVGSITCGVLLIVFGILFLVHMILPALSLTMILKLWPLVLVALGAELIIANLHRNGEETEVLKYDKGAIFLTFLLICFAMVMGFVELGMEYYSQYGYIYYN